MGTVFLVFGVVTFLVFVNALYVAAEFAAVSVRRSRVQELADAGNRRAALLLPVVRNPAALDRYVATCQIGITLSSLVLGAFGQATLAVALTPVLAGMGRLQPLAAESTAAIIVLVGLTGVQVILGELVPKSLALQNPTATGLYTVLPMRWSTWVFRWFIAVLNGSGVWLLRRMGFGAEGNRHVHSPEEIELLIAESRDGGLLEPQEQRRLHQALRLGLSTARQVMVPRTSIVAVDVTCSGQQILDLMIRTPFSRVPVYDGSIDRVIGILRSRDVVLDYVQHGRLDRFRSLMRPAHSVPETMRADHLLQFLREHRTHQALVIDEFGGVAGLVTLEDVVSELLGDVGDEFHAAPAPERLPDGRLRLAGQTPLADARRWLRATIESDADTLGGHVVNLLGRMPVVGDRCAIDGMQIEVERLRRRVPATLLVTPVPKGEPDSRG
jgi:putative hemolysin